MAMPARLKKLRGEIRTALKHPRGSHWNTLVMLTLQTIDKEFGPAQAVKAMRDMHLDREGWNIPKKNP